MLEGCHVSPSPFAALPSISSLSPFPFVILLVKTSFLTFRSAAELESVKALFAEKEKELAQCFAKVEEMTLQLKELKNGTPNGTQQKHDIERLKQELLVSSLDTLLICIFFFFFFDNLFQPCCA